MWYKAAGDANHNDSAAGGPVSVTIGQTSLAAEGITIYAIPDQNSTGDQLTPKPVVKHLGYLLKENEDYTLSYANNVNRWESGENPPTVTVTGMGGYSGTLTETFKIILPAYNGVLTVTEPSTLTYGTALGAAPTVNSTGSLSGERVTVYYATTPSGTGTVWNPSAKLNAGNYYVWAELAATGTHDKATSARVEFKVNKASPAAPSGVLAAAGYQNTYKVTLTIPSGKSYADYEYSTNNSTWTALPALKDGAFTPTGLNSDSSYTIYLRTKADSNNNASAAATATLKTPTKVLLRYDANGSTATVPASAEYDSTPPVMVGGLDDVAKDEAEENKEVTVTMTVEQKDESTATERQKQEMEEIKEAVAADSTTDEGSTELEFLDVKVEKKNEDGSTTTTEPITETSQVVEMIVPFNTSGRFGFIVYHWHGGKAEAFQKRSSPFASGSFMDGWYYVDMVAGLFHIYGSRFSTYAIGYEEGTGYTLTVENGTGSGEFAAGATITITADDPAAGKVFDKWTTSDGVSFANANSSTTTFTMPAKNVTVTATYKTASSPAPYYPGGGGYTLTYAIQTEKTEHSTVKTSYEKTTSGTRVTITATPDVGYEVGSVTVTDASGNSVKVTKNTNGTYSFTMPASKVTVTFVPAAASGDICDPFRDIDRSAWYHDGVHYALEKGIMSGMGDGQFAPSGTTTRAQLAQILWNIEGKPTYSGAIAFTDVNANEWYAPAIRWANAEGIIGGYGDGRFGPNDAVTREQLVTILYRYAKYKGVNVSAQASLAVYDDAFTVSDWAMEAMQWAVGSGLISGKTASTLDPQDKASRAEIATIIMRYCEQIAK